MRNIRRVDHEASSTHCWRVTIQRQSRMYRRDFSDGPHGGFEQALRAAIQYRDYVIAHHPSWPCRTIAILKKNNRSGISGLTRVDRWERSKGRRYRRVFWEVQWPIGNGRAKHRKFSVLKYGEDRALQMALAARETALQSLSEQTFSPFNAGA